MAAADTRKHPVWDVYDAYRNARLNFKFYCIKLNRLQHANLLLELTLALTASSSAVAGLWLWDTEGGKEAWQWLSVLSAVLAVARPILKITDKIRQLEHRVTDYRALEYDFETIMRRIKDQDAYDKKRRAEFEELKQKANALHLKHIDPSASARLRRRCQQQVNQELPVDSFYIPAGG